MLATIGLDGVQTGCCVCCRASPRQRCCEPHADRPRARAFLLCWAQSDSVAMLSPRQLWRRCRSCSIRLSAWPGTTRGVQEATTSESFPGREKLALGSCWLPDGPGARPAYFRSSGFARSRPIKAKSVSPGAPAEPCQCAELRFCRFVRLNGCHPRFVGQRSYEIRTLLIHPANCPSRSRPNTNRRERDP